VKNGTLRSVHLCPAIVECGIKELEELVPLGFLLYYLDNSWYEH